MDTHMRSIESYFSSSPYTTASSFRGWTNEITSQIPGCELISLTGATDKIEVRFEATGNIGP